MEGFSNDFQRRFKSLGANVMYVSPASVKIGGREAGSAQTLKLEDMDTLKRELAADVEKIAPEAVGGAVIKYFQKSEPATMVIATSDAYFEVNDYKPAAGRIFTPSESRDETQYVAILGHGVAETLFGGGGAIGQTVKIRDIGYRVVGVMEKRGNLGFMNVDKAAFIPIATGLKRFFNRDYLDRLTVAIQDSNQADEMEKRIKPIMRKAHRIRAGEKDDFETFRSDQMMETVTEVMLIWKAVFYSIAGISLLVGGIGIMNIMLVSVTERTREIGVRMAVGARRGDILLQFLAEALIISLLGGGFGLLLGVMFADILENVLKETGMFKIEITPFVITTAIGTSTIVGIFSGIYPAFKASRLDPVVALRYE
jgi:ABC-type antimicrobial peptide transport system permease subunit